MLGIRTNRKEEIVIQIPAGIGGAAGEQIIIRPQVDRFGNLGKRLYFDAPREIQISRRPRTVQAQTTTAANPLNAREVA